jgi:hypothetical protein
MAGASVRHLLRVMHVPRFRGLKFDYQLAHRYQQRVGMSLALDVGPSPNEHVNSRSEGFWR